MNCGWRSMKGKVLPASPDLRYIKVPGWGKGPGYRNLPIACCLMLLTFSPFFFGMMFDVLLCTLTSMYSLVLRTNWREWDTSLNKWAGNLGINTWMPASKARDKVPEHDIRKQTDDTQYGQNTCSYYTQPQKKSDFLEGIWLRLLCVNFDRWVEGRKSGESLVVAPMITATRSVLQWTPFREKNTKPPPTVRKPCLTHRESIRTPQNTSTRPCNTPLKKKPKTS